jgi:hypothetical protein
MSPHPRLEGFGPVRGSTLYLDMHINHQLCWIYTTFMVAVQLLAIGRVQRNRDKMKRGRLRLQMERAL